MFNPLQLWQSLDVTELLTDFYTANFIKAGVDPDLAKNIIRTAWEKKNLLPEKLLMLELNSYFQEAKRQAHKGITETSPTDFFDYTAVNTFLDYGANKLRVLNDVGYKYPQISKLIAVDIVPQLLPFAYPNRSVYIQTAEDASNMSLPAQSVDCINIQFVLHHIRDELLDMILSQLSHILIKGGRIILREETFEDYVSIDTLVGDNAKRGIQTDHAYTKRFYALSEKQRWEFIIANDWLVNVNNEHMQWTGMYKKWDEWVHIFSTHGFTLVRAYNLGLRLNGILKQGVHIVGEFLKVV